MAIQLDPKNAVAYNNRGNVETKKNQLEIALQDYNKSIELNTFAPLTYHNRAMLKKKMGDVDGAAADEKKALEIKAQNLSQAQ